MSSYPDFICVGAQKAATSWLYNTLKWTPGVFLPAIKELHYFSRFYYTQDGCFGQQHRMDQVRLTREGYKGKKDITKYDKMILAQLDYLESDQIDDDWYRGIFDFATEQDICGEVCPTYMSIPTRGIRRVMNINPLIRVLVLVRDPVDRIWSYMRMQTTTGASGFDLAHILSGNVPMELSMQYTDYANSIRRWKSLSGEGRFRAILYDRIKDEPHLVLDQILDFIGAPKTVPNRDISKRVYPSNQVSLPPELRAKLFRDLKPQYDFLHSMFPEEVEIWVKRHQEAMA